MQACTQPPGAPILPSQRYMLWVLVATPFIFIFAKVSQRGWPQDKSGSASSPGSFDFCIKQLQHLGIDRDSPALVTKNLNSFIHSTNTY